MKLDLSAKELLALHNLLYTRFEHGDECIESDGDPQLKQVYDRIRSCVLSALSGKSHDKLDMFEAWRSKEQPKIDKLNEELDDIRKQQSDLPVATSLKDLLVEDDDDFTVMSEYPRKGSRGSRQRKGSKQ